MSANQPAPVRLGARHLKNRVAMALLSRCRTDNEAAAATFHQCGEHADLDYPTLNA